MSELATLEPKKLFGFFEKICSIPHGSGNTNAIADYLVSFAKSHVFDYYRDKANNVIIRKPATKGYEDADTVILQGHHDMVCEKDTGIEFDFAKDSIEPVIDGDYIRAKGTTLGGDNGVAVAMMLAILDSKDLKHPPIEALFTADEEIGMIGAFALDCSVLKGHKLINLDSEAEGVLMCSCAGGENVYSTVPVEREDAQLKLISIEISGLTSGHSGVEIDKGRANSNVLMGRLLHELHETADYRLVSLEGGTRETAIAANSKAVIGSSQGCVAGLLKAINDCAAVYGREYSSTEPNMKITASEGEIHVISVLTDQSGKMVANVLGALPDGVQAMSADMPGLVQTSTNFGILKLKDNELTFTNTIRSSMTTQKEWIIDKISAIVELAGGKTVTGGSYPGWAYNPHSAVKNTILEAYEAVTGGKASVEAVHAGIECGLFADSIKNLDCVSIGPNMWDVHTPREHLSISSAVRTYEILLKTLEMSK